MSEKADQQTVVALQRPAKKNSKLTYVAIGATFIVLVVCSCIFGYGYYQLSKVNLSLAKAIGSLQYQAATNEQQLANLQKELGNAQQSVEKSQLLSEKQEKMISDWQASQQGNLEKWYVAEAQYLVRLASDHVTFTQNIPMALTLLRRADQVLASQNDTSLVPIRKSLAADLVNLQTQPQIDTTKLYLVLSGINTELSQLPLPASPLQNQTKRDVATTPVNDTALPWWKMGLNKTWDALSKIVIVRYNGSNALPLVMPEEKVYLYQNLHAQMENAMWATLHGNASVYQSSLAKTIGWIRQYFQQDSPVTQTLLQRLQGLQSLNIQPANISLAVTQHMFDTYLLQSDQPKAIH
jgi:uroporphyrin-3 C-methyltransferase